MDADKVLYVANDWHTGLLPLYLKHRAPSQSTPPMCALLLHNMAHQVRPPAAHFSLSGEGGAFLN